MKGIDFRVRLRRPESLEAWVPEPIPQFAPYVDIYKMKPRLEYEEIDETLKKMAKNEIGKAVICAGGSIKENKFIHETCESYPEKFIGVMGFSMGKGVRSAVNQIKEQKERFPNLRGINLTPFMFELQSNDKKLYPIYTLAQEWGMPVIIHSSLHFYAGSSMRYGDPAYTDEVAVDFPDMKIVLSHAGNGFGDHTLPIAQRHKNIYLEVSAIRPKYFSPNHMKALNSYLKDRFLFGSDYPLLDFDVATEWKEYVEDSVWDKFFFNNAKRIFKD